MKLSTILLLLLGLATFSAGVWLMFDSPGAAAMCIGGGIIVITFMRAEL
jgi:hypothetical protein